MHLWSGPQHLDVLRRSGRLESARETDQFRECLALAKFVGHRSAYLASDLHIAFVKRHEYDIARLETAVARGVAVDQIVVEVECRECTSATAQLHAAKTADLRWSARRVQRRQNRPSARDLIATGRHDVADDKDLIRANACDR